MNKLVLLQVNFLLDDTAQFRRSVLRSVALIMSSVLLLSVATAQATTITVTSVADSGTGTLRQAILDASSSGGDTINFAVTGVITLTSDGLSIAKNLTISGPGANMLTVRRAPGLNTPEFNIFLITNRANVSISNLMLTNGRNYNGGAIYNGGSTLTVNNCVLTGNSGGGYGGG